MEIAYVARQLVLPLSYAADRRVAEEALAAFSAASVSQ